MLNLIYLDTLRHVVNYWPPRVSCRVGPPPMGHTCQRLASPRQSMCLQGFRIPRKTNLTLLTQLEITTIDFYCPLVFIAKLALLLQYLRLFVPVRQGLVYRAIHVLIWSNLIVYTVSFFWAIFACSPREKLWNPLVPGKCVNPVANSIWTTCWNIISDLSILALPLWTIWHLN